MALGTQRRSASWLSQVAALIGSSRDRGPRRPIRRLGIEGLERRIVLSVAAETSDDETADEPSLAEYASQEQEMGPLPAEDYESDSGETTTYSSDPVESDSFFASMEGEGEGDGSGSGSGDGSDSGAGGGTGTGSGSGSGSGTGSGSGSGSGSGATSGSTNEPPVIQGSHQEGHDWLIISGSVSDDGPVAGLTVTISGLVSATVTTDEFGNFWISVPHPLTTGSIWLDTTDAQGLAAESFEIFLS